MSPFCKTADRRRDMPPFGRRQDGATHVHTRARANKWTDTTDRIQRKTRRYSTAALPFLVQKNKKVLFLLMFSSYLCTRSLRTLRTRVRNGHLNRRGDTLGAREWRLLNQDMKETAGVKGQPLKFPRQKSSMGCFVRPGR